MPSEIETTVLRMLSAIEPSPNTAKRIAEMGPAAVTVLCEVAVGAYPGLRAKVRTNAVGLLGWVDRPQARETALLLLGDPDPDVAIRAMRSAGRVGDADAVPVLARLLESGGTAPLLAAEAVRALDAIGSDEARDVLSRYVRMGDDEAAPPHRRSDVVAETMRPIKIDR